MANNKHDNWLNHNIEPGHQPFPTERFINRFNDNTMTRIRAFQERPISDIESEINATELKLQDTDDNIDRTMEELDTYIAQHEQLFSNFRTYNMLTAAERDRLDIINDNIRSTKKILRYLNNAEKPGLMMKINMLKQDL